MMKNYQLRLIMTGVAIATIFSACTFKNVVPDKDITYLKANQTGRVDDQKLNVFSPRENNGLSDVFLFIHGGIWNSGKRDLYWFIGNGFANKGVVAVVINYPLSPKANYDDMAKAVASSIKWVRDNIRLYGGDPERIFIGGHSAGGHLAALIAVQDKYFTDLGMKNPVKGAILIDAAGVDMYDYLKANNFPENHTFFKTFTHDESEWKKGSPIYQLHKDMPPMMVYVGEKTYPFIAEGNEKFIQALEQQGDKPEYHVLKKKKHVAMITQFFKASNPCYDEIISFMRRQ